MQHVPALLKCVRRMYVNFTGLYVDTDSWKFQLAYSTASPVIREVRVDWLRYLFVQRVGVKSWLLSWHWQPSRALLGQYSRQYKLRVAQAHSAVLFKLEQGARTDTHVR
jgi:hypothetical protein